MIFILLFLICSLLFFKYRSDARYLLHPVIIVVGVFALGVFVSALNFSSWGDISFTTLSIIFTGILFFCIGHLGSKRRLVIGSLKKDNLNEIYRDIPLNKTIIIIAFMIVITILDFNDIRNLAGENISGIMQIVISARHNLYIKNEAVSHVFLIQQGIYLCRALAYIYVYAFFYRVRIQKMRAKLLYLIPVVIYAIQALLSTGRTEFIYLFYAMLIINYLLLQGANQWKYRLDFRFSKQIIVALIAFVTLFLFISNARNSSTFNIEHTLSIYLGSSIKAFDVYISENGIWSVSTFFGEYTQPLLYSVLRAIGSSSNTVVDVLPPIYISGHLTNIYTAFGRYIHDYGLVGVAIIMMLLGYGYSYAFNSMECNNSTGISVMIYAFLSYPLVEMAIEERFFSNLITARTIYCLMYMIILFKWL